MVPPIKRQWDTHWWAKADCVLSVIKTALHFGVECHFGITNMHPHEVDRLRQLMPTELPKQHGVHALYPNQARCIISPWDTIDYWRYESVMEPLVHIVKYDPLGILTADQALEALAIELPITTLQQMQEKLDGYTPDLLTQRRMDITDKRTKVPYVRTVGIQIGMDDSLSRLCRNIDNFLLACQDMSDPDPFHHPT